MTQVLFDRLKSNLAQCINDGTIYFVTDSNGNFTQIALGDGSKSHVVGIGPKMDDATKQDLMSKLGLTISSDMGTIQLGKLANYNGVSSQKVITYERTGLGTDTHEISTVGYVQQYMKTAQAMVYVGVFNAQTKEITDYNNAIISPSEAGNVTFDYLLNGNEGETLLTSGMSFIVGTAGDLEGYTGVSVFGGETKVEVGDMIIIINVQQKEGDEGGSTYNEASILVMQNTNSKIADGAITTAKIADAAVTNEKLSTDIQSLIRNLSKTATFAGIATPTTNPGTPDGNVFYIANGKGTYTNFGGIDVTEDEVVILYYDTVWHKNAAGIASNDKIAELGGKISGGSTEYSKDSLNVGAYVYDPSNQCTKDTPDLTKTSFGYLLVSVKEGQKMHIETSGAATQYEYILFDKDGKFYKRGGVASGEVETYDIVIDGNTKYVGVNCRIRHFDNFFVSLSEKGIVEKLDNVESKVNGADIIKYHRLDINDADTLVRKMAELMSDTSDTKPSYEHRYVISVGEGTYNVDSSSYNVRGVGGLFLMPYMTLQGAGRDKTILKFHYGCEDANKIENYSGLNAAYTCIIKDLTVDVMNVRYAIHSDGGIKDAGIPLTDTEIVLENVRLIHNGFSTTEWNNTTSYSVGKVVMYNGILYKCLVANSGNQPSGDSGSTTYWGYVYQSSNAWGAGIKSGCKRVFKNCIFDSKDRCPFFCHNADYQDKSYSIYMEGCQFINRATKGAVGFNNPYYNADVLLNTYGNTAKGYVTMKDCVLDKYIAVYQQSSSVKTLDWEVNCNNQQLVILGQNGNAHKNKNYTTGNTRIVRMTSSAVAGTPVSIDVQNGSELSNYAEFAGVLINDVDVSSDAYGYIATSGAILPTNQTLCKDFAKGTLIGWKDGEWVEDNTHPILVALSDYVVKVLSVSADMSSLYKEVNGIQNTVNNISKYAVSISEKPYFNGNGDSWIDEESTSSFIPKSLHLDFSHKGNVTPDERYVALGFDDFRASDFSMIIPLLDKYGAKAEFNRVHSSVSTDDVDKERVDNVIYGGHEIGDHTWMHQKFPYDEPLFNGQDPTYPDGNQVPYPTNQQMRENRGDGKNVFGIDITTPVSAKISYDGPSINTAWKDLSAAECQKIRDWFSVMKDTSTNLVVLLDELSNKYLGTTGSSRGSWDNTTGCYTGGIFTGCKTSANHEIWERILDIVDAFLKDKFGLNFKLNTWSLPGSKSSFCYFENNGKYYYDAAHTIPVNNLARFASTLYKNNDGTPKMRSWTDVLFSHGYKVTHDSTFPNRRDGQNLPMMSKQMILNAQLSRPHALIYPSERSLNFDTMATEYTKGVSLKGTKPYEVQMYESNGNFRRAIEAWRMNTANGVIFSEVIDSADTWSERMILEGLLKYAKCAGIKLITKAEAYDICFNHSITEGNLLYNPLLRNTAKEFLPTATTVPDNPDGFIGNCSVDNTDGIPTLITAGQVIYDHFGIPYGKIKFSADIKGTGSIEVRMIKNSTNIKTIATSSVSITTKNIVSVDDYSAQVVDFNIPLNELTEYEGLCAGYGEKVIGVRFVISSGLSMRNMCMKKV